MQQSNVPQVQARVKISRGPCRRRRDSSAGGREARAVLNLTADDGGCSLVSLLAGCWWAAPVPRVEMAHRVFLQPECGACGRTSECLPLHLLAGQYPGEAPCPCVEASRCRAEWEAAVGRLYARYADAEATVAFAIAPPRTLQRVALMLGWARGVELPWELSCALPRAFADTWGAWSRERLDALGADGAPRPAAE